jgi:hypothetical protein
MRIGIVGTSGCCQNSYSLSTEALMMACGGNTGNLAFRYAVTNHIADEKLYFSYESDPALVKDSCDLLVIPQANEINPNRDETHAHQADFIETVDLPCLSIGLGAQAPDFKHDLKLSKDTLRWLHAIAERSKCISVRGEFTANVLAKAGIKNTIVLGCPSLLINPNPNLGKVIENKFNSIIPQNLIITAGQTRKSSLRNVERKLVRWLQKYNGNYVVQAPDYLVTIAREGISSISEKDIDSLQNYLRPRLIKNFESRSNFMKFIRQHFRIFFDAGAWIEYLSSFDLSMGVRLHGNMLAVQAATPGICVYHDSRTQELCSVTKIPNISTQQFLNAQNIQELVKIVSFNGDSFDKNRSRIACEYRQLLCSYDITTSNILESLIV